MDMSLAERALRVRKSNLQSADEDIYDDGYLRVEHQHYYLTCDGQSIHLPRTEFLLLSRLVRSLERVVSAQDLWRSAWGNDKPLNPDSLHVYIYRLRNKIQSYHLHIDTVVNVGYRLLPPHQAEKNR